MSQKEDRISTGSKACLTPQSTWTQIILETNIPLSEKGLFISFWERVLLNYDRRDNRELCQQRDAILWQIDKCIFISTPAWDVKDTQYVADGFRLVSI